MREPTVQTPGHALGDAIGITWMLRRVGDVLTVGHGGTTIGQHSSFTMVPERRFAVTVLSNCGPNGEQLNTELEKWVLREYLGVVEQEPAVLDADDRLLGEYTGHYEDSVALLADITARPGRLSVKIAVRPELVAEVGDIDRFEEPIVLGLLDGSADRYVVPEGSMMGMRGFFTRSDDGRVDSINLGGRRLERTS
jgi:hypothetical protein